MGDENKLLLNESSRKSSNLCCCCPSDGKKAKVGPKYGSRGHGVPLQEPDEESGNIQDTKGNGRVNNKDQKSGLETKDEEWHLRLNGKPRTVHLQNWIDGKGKDSAKKLHYDVYRVLHNNEPLALKVAIPDDQSASNEIEREYQTLKQLTHENIVRVLGYGEVLEGLTLKSKQPRQACILTELSEKGNLQTLLQTKNPLNWTTRLQIAIGVARGLRYLHSRHPPVIHRDLEPKHVCFRTSFSSPFLVSFFNAKEHTGVVLSSLETEQKTPTKNNNIEKFDFPRQHSASPLDDLTSFGFILYQLLKWQDTLQRDPSMTSMITEGEGREYNAPQGYVHLMKLCWSNDELKRISIDDVISQLSQMLNDLEPRCRRQVDASISESKWTWQTQFLKELNHVKERRKLILDENAPREKLKSLAHWVAEIQTCEIQFDGLREVIQGFNHFVSATSPLLKRENRENFERTIDHLIKILKDMEALSRYTKQSITQFTCLVSFDGELGTAHRKWLNNSKRESTTQDGSNKDIVKALANALDQICNSASSTCFKRCLRRQVVIFNELRCIARLLLNNTKWQKHAKNRSVLWSIKDMNEDVKEIKTLVNKTFVCCRYKKLHALKEQFIGHYRKFEELTEGDELIKDDDEDYLKELWVIIEKYESHLRVHTSLFIHGMRNYDLGRFPHAEPKLKEYFEQTEEKKHIEDEKKQQCPCEKGFRVIVYRTVCFIYYLQNQAALLDKWKEKPNFEMLEEKDYKEEQKRKDTNKKKGFAKESDVDQQLDWKQIVAHLPEGIKDLQSIGRGAHSGYQTLAYYLFGEPSFQHIIRHAVANILADDDSLQRIRAYRQLSEIKKEVTNEEQDLELGFSLLTPLQTYHEEILSKESLLDWNDYVGQVRRSAKPMTLEELRIAAFIFKIDISVTYLYQFKPIDELIHGSSVRGGEKELKIKDQEGNERLTIEQIQNHRSCLYLGYAYQRFKYGQIPAGMSKFIARFRQKQRRSSAKQLEQFAKKFRLDENKENTEQQSTFLRPDILWRIKTGGGNPAELESMPDEEQSMQLLEIEPTTINTQVDAVEYKYQKNDTPASSSSGSTETTGKEEEWFAPESRSIRVICHEHSLKRVVKYEREWTCDGKLLGNGCVTQSVFSKKKLDSTCTNDSVEHSKQVEGDEEEGEKEEEEEEHTILEEVTTKKNNIQKYHYKHHYRCTNDECDFDLCGLCVKHWKVSLTGLSLSGGGIRSAAFQTGVLVAFANREKLLDIDFISTVSGGGYTGSAFSTQFFKKPGEIYSARKSLDHEFIKNIARETRDNMLSKVPYFDFGYGTFYIILGLFIKILMTLTFATIFASFLNDWMSTIGNDDEWCNGTISSDQIYTFYRQWGRSIFSLTGLRWFLLIIFFGLILILITYWIYTSSGLWWDNKQSSQPQGYFLFKKIIFDLLLPIFGMACFIHFFLHSIFAMGYLVAVDPSKRQDSTGFIIGIGYAGFMIFSHATQLSLSSEDGGGIGALAGLFVDFAGSSFALGIATLLGLTGLQDKCVNTTCDGDRCHPYHFFYDFQYEGSWINFQVICIFVFAILFWSRQLLKDATPLGNYYRRALVKAFYKWGEDLEVKNLSKYAPYLILNTTVPCTQLPTKINPNMSLKTKDLYSVYGLHESLPIFSSYRPFEVTKDCMGCVELGYRRYPEEVAPRYAWLLDFRTFLSDAMGASAAAISSNMGSYLLSSVGNVLVNFLGLDMGGWFPFHDFKQLPHVFYIEPLLLSYGLPWILIFFSLIFKKCDCGLDDESLLLIQVAFYWCLGLCFCLFIGPRRHIIMIPLRLLFPAKTGIMKSTSSKEGSVLDRCCLPNVVMRSVYTCFRGAKFMDRGGNVTPDISNISYVYLSDGGHFENLGAYQLLRRRCGRIYAFDGGNDVKQLESLYTLLRVSLQEGLIIDYEFIQHNDTQTISGLARRSVHPTRMSDDCFIHLLLTYPDSTHCHLWYAKSTLTGQEVRQELHLFKLVKADQFPNHSTADQALDSQTCTMYSQLGESVANRMLDFDQKSDDF